MLDNEKHKELNSIAYYKYNGDINSLTNLSRISANYLISILKTIYIKRYLTKRQENEYLHINLLLKDEFYIFPPDIYSHTYMYHFPFFGKQLAIIQKIECQHNFLTVYMIILKLKIII